MTLALPDPWIALAKEWQPLLAGMLAVVASIILGVAIIVAAKIRAAAPEKRAEALTRDLRSSLHPGPTEPAANDSAGNNLEKLRSLLRSALSSLSSVNPNNETARVLCARIAAFQWQHFPVPAGADNRIQEGYGTLLNQFELLRKLLRQEWSSTEASSILIQMNASARTLIDALGQKKSGGSRPPHSMKRE